MLSIQSLSSLISFLINSYNALLSILLFFYLLLRCFSLHYARRPQLSSALLFVVSSYKIMSKIASPLRLYALFQGLGIVENIGFEPMTPCLQSRCSSQLS